MPDASRESPTFAVNPSGTRRWAAVDVGSHSVHLLLAEIGAGQVIPLADESTVLGLGDRVDERHAVGDLDDALVAAIEGYVHRGLGAGARAVAVVGTEPLRRAADAASVVARVQSTTGVALHVLDHDEEGRLTFIGATGGRALRAVLAVIDVGGGSTEVTLGGPTGVTDVIELAVGGARLTRLVAPQDPLDAADVAALRDAARDLAGALPPAVVGEVLAVGGTASNLVKVIGEAACGGCLTLGRLNEALAALKSEPAGKAAERFAISPARARILPAGVAILEAVMERYGLESATVVEAGIREGLVLAQDRAGIAWRDQLSELAGGWR